MKILVVYYSRTGKTKMVAELLAQQLQADIDEIRDTKDRRGMIGYLLAGRDAGGHRTTTLHPVKYDPSGYDLVVVATPVWASNISTPVLTYLQRYKSAIRSVAFVTTQAGGVTDRVLEGLAAAAGKTPVAALGIAGDDFKQGSHLEKIRALAETISARHC